MIRKETIIKTAVPYWSQDDQCFVVESPLFTKTAGIGDSLSQAREHFRHMVDIAYEDLKAGKMAGLNQSGRPAKGNIQLSCRVLPDTYEYIKKIAGTLEISQGECLDLITFFHSVRAAEQPEMPTYIEIARRLSSIEKTMRRCAGGVAEAKANRYRVSKVKNKR